MTRKVNEKVLKEIIADFAEAKTSNKDSSKTIKAARKKAMRVNLKLPKDLRREFCHKCNTLFTSKNSRIRILKRKKTITCLNCKNITRIPIK